MTELNLENENCKDCDVDIEDAQQHRLCGLRYHKKSNQLAEKGITS